MGIALIQALQSVHRQHLWNNSLIDTLSCGLSVVKLLSLLSRSFPPRSVFSSLKERSIHLYYGRHTSKRDLLSINRSLKATERITKACKLRASMLHMLAASPAGYVFDTISTAISKPTSAPNIAPPQGLAVIPQVLPAHLPKYPIAPPIIAPSKTPII